MMDMNDIIFFVYLRNRKIIAGDNIVAATFSRWTHIVYVHNHSIIDSQVSVFRPRRIAYHNKPVSVTVPL